MHKAEHFREDSVNNEPRVFTSIGLGYVRSIGVIRGSEQTARRWLHNKMIN
jgi:hypothetical protein